MAAYPEERLSKTRLSDGLEKVRGSIRYLSNLLRTANTMETLAVRMAISRYRRLEYALILKLHQYKREAERRGGRPGRPHQALIAEKTRKNRNVKSGYSAKRKDNVQMIRNAATVMHRGSEDARVRTNAFVNAYAKARNRVRASLRASRSRLS